MYSNCWQGHINNQYKTVKDVLDELTDDQRMVVYFLIGKAVEYAMNMRLPKKESDIS